jgi:hypothetical protein
VGKEDKDIDNDGDHDKTDKYLLNRRKAVGAAIARKKKLKEEAATAVASTDEDEKEITEKKVKNKVIINPEVKEEVEQIDEKSIQMQRRVDRYLGRSERKAKERLGRQNERKDKKAALAAMEKQYRGMKSGIYSSHEPEGGEQLDEMPYQVVGSPDGKKEKKIGKPVKSKKYADARAAELADTHKKTGGKYRSEYTEATYPSDFRNPDGSKRAVAKKKYGMPKQHDQETDRYGRRKTVDEAAEDRARDRRMERGGVGGNVDYSRPPTKKASNKELGIKPMTDEQREKRKKEMSAHLKKMFKK